MVSQPQMTEFGLNDIEDFRQLANKIIDLYQITFDVNEKTIIKAALDIVLARIRESVTKKSSELEPENP